MNHESTLDLCLVIFTIQALLLVVFCSETWEYDGSMMAVWSKIMLMLLLKMNSPWIMDMPWICRQGCQPRGLLRWSYNLCRSETWHADLCVSVALEGSVDAQVGHGASIHEYVYPLFWTRTCMVHTCSIIFIQNGALFRKKGQIFLVCPCFCAESSGQWDFWAGLGMRGSGFFWWSDQICQRATCHNVAAWKLRNKCHLDHLRSIYCKAFRFSRQFFRGLLTIAMSIWSGAFTSLL